jgi:hypothetical protein
MAWVLDCCLRSARPYVQFVVQSSINKCILNKQKAIWSFYFTIYEGSTSIFSFFSNFIVELGYNNLRGFHCDNSIDAYSGLWTVLHSPLYSCTPLLSSLLFQSVWWVWLCCLHVYICNVLWSSSPLSIFSFPSDFPPQRVPF